MKATFIIYPGASYIRAGDGSKMQAEIWARELEHKVHQVDRINSRGHYNSIA